MNFEREFIKDIPYRKFKRVLGREDALEYVFHLWAKCEASKSDCIVLPDTEDLALLMDAPDGLSGPTILDAFLKSGLLVEIEPLTYRAVVWAEQNAGLISRWENGRKGGSPKKENSLEGNQGEGNSREVMSIEDNSKETNETERKDSEEKKKKPTQPHVSEDKETEDNQREEKETKQSEGNESKVKGPVSPILTEDKPNYNLKETEKETFVPTDWEIGSGSL